MASPSRHNLVETLLGFVVLVIAGFFLVYLQNRTHGGLDGGGYSLNARFERVDGLSVGSDVQLAGIKVGTISALKLDTATFFAQAVIHIANPAIQLPKDSMAQISSEGLLGGRYVSIVPGGSDEMIAPGGSINFTQPPFDLVQALGEYIFSKPKDGNDAPGGDNAGNAKPSAGHKAKTASPTASPIESPIPGAKLDQPIDPEPTQLPAGE